MHINVWVIEDHIIFRNELLQIIAESEDIHCVKYFGDVEGMERFLEDTSDLVLPHVVLMDIMLPGKDGIEGTRILRGKFPQLPVLILTGRNDSDRIYKSLSAGASNFLLKAVAYEKILESVRNAAVGDMLMPQAVAKKMRAYFNTYDGNKKYKLTKRELEVLTHMCDGLSQIEIAEALFISGNTVSHHVRSIYTKLEVTTRGAAVSKSIRERIIP
ncbi:MAG: response regulator [Rhodothermales bacterium]